MSIKCAASDGVRVVVAPIAYNLLRNDIDITKMNLTFYGILSLLTKLDDDASMKT